MKVIGATLFLTAIAISNPAHILSQMWQTAMAILTR